MTFKQFTDEIATLRNAWATDSNTGDPSQTELLEFCERFIVGMESALEAVGAHPDPPPPRVR